MTARENVDIDERERIRQHEEVKDEVRDQVHSRIANEARATDADRARERAAAESMKQQAMSEVVSTEREISRGRSAARGSQFVDYAFFLIYAIIALAFTLEAVGARESNGFNRFVETLAWPFVAPFRGILNDPVAGNSQLMLSYVVAFVAYVVLHLAITGLFRLFSQRKTVV